MNDQISWDSSLVKKFSSSNHFKMLNQLRSEVKKYPLNKKKHTISNPDNDINPNRNENIDKSYSKNISISDNSNLNKDTHINKSTISFNNSKNFSIYNNNESTNEKRESKVIIDNKTNENDTSSTFKTRLEQIDMK